MKLGFQVVCKLEFFYSFYIVRLIKIMDLNATGVCLQSHPPSFIKIIRLLVSWNFGEQNSNTEDNADKLEIHVTMWEKDSKLISTLDLFFFRF